MKALSAVLLLAISTANLFASETLLPQRVLYIGHRASDFEPFLKAHFTNAASVPLDGFKPSQAKDFDVVLLDWPQSETARGLRVHGSPLGKREEWNKPTVLLGSAGLNLAVAWTASRVRSLNCETNCPRLIPYRPSEVPTGGAGVACPPGT